MGLCPRSAYCLAPTFCPRLSWAQIWPDPGPAPTARGSKGSRPPLTAAANPQRPSAISQRPQSAPTALNDLDSTWIPILTSPLVG